MHKGRGKRTRLVLPGTANVGFPPQEIVTSNRYGLKGRMPIKKVGRLAFQAGHYPSWHHRRMAMWTSGQKVLGIVLSKSRTFYTVAIARNIGIVGVLDVHGGVSNVQRGQVVHVQVALPCAPSQVCRVSLAVPRKDSQPGSSEKHEVVAMTHGYLLGFLSRDTAEPIGSVAKLIGVAKTLEERVGNSIECEYAADANHFVWIRSPHKRTIIDVLAQFAPR